MNGSRIRMAAPTHGRPGNPSYISAHRLIVPIGPPKGIEVTDFNIFFDFLDFLNFGLLEIVDMTILKF